MNRLKLKRALKSKTGCNIQHDGWCCGTCFFAISKRLTNQDWQNVLLIRGDSEESELHNLPKDRVKSYNKIMKLCGVNAL